MDNVNVKMADIDAIVRRVTPVYIVKSIEHHVYPNRVKITGNVLIEMKPSNVNVHLTIKGNSVNNPLIYVEQTRTRVFVSMVALVK